MKNIPARPKMTREETEILQEQFMRGEGRTNKPAEIKPPKAKNTAIKGKVKMYNLPMPIDGHAKAKMLAIMEGKSLADYIIGAVRKANDEAAAKYSGL